MAALFLPVAILFGRIYIFFFFFCLVPFQHLAAIGFVPKSIAPVKKLSFSFVPLERSFSFSQALDSVRSFWSVLAFFMLCVLNVPLSILFRLDSQQSRSFVPLLWMPYKFSPNATRAPLFFPRLWFHPLTLTPNSFIRRFSDSSFSTDWLFTKAATTTTNTTTNNQ